MFATREIAACALLTGASMAFGQGSGQAAVNAMMGEEPAFDYMKKLHRNISNYTRSGQARAPNVAKGEVAIGISFIFGFDAWRHNRYPVKTVAPCEGASYEVGGIAMVKGQRNKEAAERRRLPLS